MNEQLINRLFPNKYIAMYNYKEPEKKVFKFLLKKYIYINTKNQVKISKIIIKSNNNKLKIYFYQNNKQLFNLPLLIGEFADISINEIVQINKNTKINEHSLYGLKDKNTLESVLAIMNSNYFGVDRFPTIIDKASYLWYAIATKQMFHDGNKRTAMNSAVELLFQNIYKLNLSDKELYKISLDIANNKISKEKLKKIIIKYIYI